MEKGISLFITPKVSGEQVNHSINLQILSTKTTQDDNGNEMAAIDWATPEKTVLINDCTSGKGKQLIDFINQKLIDLELV